MVNSAEHEQCCDPVGRQSEERADLLDRGGVRLVEHRLEPCLLRHRRGRTGDAGADDQGGAWTGHDRCFRKASQPRATNQARLSVITMRSVSPATPCSAPAAVGEKVEK